MSRRRLPILDMATTPTDGDVPVYDDATDLWVPGAGALGVMGVAYYQELGSDTSVTFDDDDIGNPSWGLTDDDGDHGSTLDGGFQIIDFEAGVYMVSWQQPVQCRPTSETGLEQIEMFFEVDSTADTAGEILNGVDIYVAPIALEDNYTSTVYTSPIFEFTTTNALLPEVYAFGHDWGLRSGRFTVVRFA